VRCWYRWLISQDLYLEEIDTIRIGLEHADTNELIEHLCPYLKEDKKIKTTKQIDEEMKKAFSFESMLIRIKVIDKIMAQCVTL